MLNKNRLWLTLSVALGGLFMAAVVIAGFLLVQFSRELPDAQTIRNVNLKVPLRVYSADGVLISEFGNERRMPLDYAETPKTIIDAVLASEDDSFFEHSGIDFKGLIRAALSNSISGRSGQGASTITMQVARNFFLSPEKTYTRKIKEVLLALRLEQILSKEEILSLYLNKIFLGHRSYGFGAAAQTYYGHDLNELTLAQTAMLAGLPKAPSSYNPLRNPERAKIRRDYVLSRLRDLGKINQSDYESSIAEEISAKRHKRNTGLAAPHIAEMVRQQLISQYGEDAYWQGLNVYTTILSKQQIKAQQALRTGLQQYDRRHGFRGAIGKVDLSALKQRLADNPELDQETELEISLENYPTSQEQVPAVVLSVEQKSAKLWTRNFNEVDLVLENNKWARRYKTANLRGDPLESMSEVLKQGDVVYVKPRSKVSVTENPDGSTNDTNISWQLSQIPNVGGAIISVHPSTGEVLSLAGGYDFFLNKFNRAVQSIRQPGSNIKPFIYSASLDQGFTPASLISGAPIVITDPSHGTLWRPENYSGRFFGPTRMREALSKSINLVSIRLLRAIGIPYTRSYIERFGIDMSRFSPSLTMALGSGGVTPMEMITAYTSLANGGYKIEPYFIGRITDRNDKLVYQAPKPEFCDECFADYLPKPAPPEDLELDQELDSQIASIEEDLEPISEDLPKETINTDESLISSYTAPRIMSHANNFLTVSMMKDVINRGTARKALSLNRQDLAGKTGTTNDYIDAWFTGFNSQVATTVWVGFDEPQSMGRGEAGSVAALPIWIDYMKEAMQDIEEDYETIPPYIEAQFINQQTGKPTDETDPGAIMEYSVNDELTPEYALMRELYPYIDDIAEQETKLDAIDDLELNIDGTFDNLEAVELPTAIDPELRIIEDDDDTEGLF